MFKCEKCGNHSQPGEKQRKVVVETRTRSYTEKRKARYNGPLEDVNVGQGTEIVREAKYCGPCATPAAA